MQASQLQKEPSDQDITENWAGTVLWNDVWEKSVEAEAEVLKKSKQAALAAASTDGVVVSEAAAPFAAGTLSLLAPIDTLFCPDSFS